MTFVSQILFIARASLSHLRLLSMVVLGVMLAVTVMASSVIYFDSLGDVALQRELDSLSQDELNVVAVARLSPVDEAGHDALGRAVEQAFDRHLGKLISRTEWAMKSPTFYAVEEDRYLDVTKLVSPGANTVTYYHFDDEELGVAVRVWPSETLAPSSSRLPNPTPTAPARTEAETTRLGLLARHETPRTWTVDLPQEFDRVEIGIYRKGRVPVARYAGWNAWLKVNDESVWEFRRLDVNQRGIVYDHVLGLEAPLEERGSDDKRAFFMVVPALAEHAELISGQWPALATGQVSGEMLSVEAALPAEAAEEFGLAPGDTFVVDPFWDDDNDQMTVRIAGVYGWRDQDGAFWSKLDDALYLTDDSLRFAPLTVSEETFTGAIGPYYPKMDGDRAWWMESDVHRLRASDGEAVIAAFDAVRADLTRSVDGYDHRTAIPGALERTQLRLVYNRMPMTIVVFLLVGVVLYYVATLSSLLVGVQRGSIALLRSRSASYRQIVSAYTVQALALAAVAIVIGPFVAAAGVRLIGAMPMFHALNAGALLPARATGEAYLVALTGGALGFLALVVPAARTARFGLLQEQRASTRPPRLPAFQRYYLDLVFLGGVLLVLWQLSRHGPFISKGVAGHVTVDQISLALPAAVMLAAGFALLRLFPVAIDLLGRGLASRRVGSVVSPSLLLGVWQMARNPGHYSRLSLLVILTAGLGVFAASFSTTLERGSEDRALYESGAALRVVGVSSSSALRVRTATDAVAGLPGVQGVSPVYRTHGFDVTTGASDAFQLLAIEPSSLGNVAWTRSDFASEPFDEVLARLNTAASGVSIPRDARWLTANVRPQEQRDYVNLIARVSDAAGHLYSLNLGNPFRYAPADRAFDCRAPEPGAPPEWCRLAADISALQETAVPPEMPLRLEFIGVGVFSPGSSGRWGRGQPNVLPGTLDIDDIATVSEGGDLRVLEPFDDISEWQTATPGLGEYRATLELLEDAESERAGGVAHLTWDAAYPRVFRGVLIGQRRATVPVLASSSFMDRSAYRVGDLLTVSVLERRLEVELVGVIDYFPTLDPTHSAFLVGSVDRLWLALNVDRLGASEQVNELWVGTEAGSADAVADALRRSDLPYLTIVDREQLLASARADPLVSAGWQALLAIAFFTALAVSAVGFVGHVLAALPARRAELALLTSVGLSTRQFIGLVLLEQTLVIVPPLAIGAFAGGAIGATIMTYLGAAGEGLKLVPPMVLAVDWGVLAAIFGTVGVMFCVASCLVVLALWRSVRGGSVQTVLRLGLQ